MSAAFYRVSPWIAGLFGVSISVAALIAWAEQPIGYRLTQGNGDRICELMLQRLNTEIARKPLGPVCVYDVLQSVPGVTPPKWKTLDLRRNKELYKRFVLAQRVHRNSWDEVFADIPPAEGQRLAEGSMPGDGELELEWEFAIQRKP